MNQKVKSMLYKITFLAMCITTINAEVHYSKTFLMPQYHKPYDNTHIFFWNKAREELHIKNHKELEVDAFYQESVQDKNLATYFGASGNTTISVGDDADFIAETFVHNPSLNGSMTGKFSLAPKRTVSGINLGWNCATELNYYRWYAALNLPFMSVSHDLRASVLYEKKEIIENQEYGILDFFRGNVNQKTTSRSQVPLTSAKFGGSQTATGLASLDMLIGCEVVTKDDCGIKLYATSSVASGNKVTGEYLFQPILGTGRHDALGLGIETLCNVYKKEKLKIDLVTGLDAAYNFAATEVRTLGVKDIHGERIPLWIWYSLVSKNGKKGVIPAANILTCPMIIFPGVTFEAKMNLLCSWNFIDFIAGYKLRTKAAETGWIKSFEEKSYALTPNDYDCSSAFAPIQTITDADYNPLLTKESLNLSAALTPAQLTHSFSAGLVLKLAWGDLPILIKSRINYEVATDNAAFEGYDVHLGLGVNF